MRILEIEGVVEVSGSKTIEWLAFTPASPYYRRPPCVGDPSPSLWGVELVQMNYVPSNQTKPRCKSVFKTALREKLHAQTYSENRSFTSHQSTNLISKAQAREVAHSIVKCANTGKHYMGILAKFPGI